MEYQEIELAAARGTPLPDHPDLRTLYCYTLKPPRLKNRKSGVHMRRLAFITIVKPPPGRNTRSFCSGRTD